VPGAATWARMTLVSTRAPTVMLTLGRLPKALDVARALHAVGCRIIVAEPYSRHLTGASRTVARSYTVTSPRIDAVAYREDLLRIIGDEGVELVVPISEEIVHVAQLHEYLSPQVRLQSMPAPVIHEVHDKLRFIEVCRRAGVAAPATVPLADAQAREWARREPLVVKPRFSCSGRGLHFLDPDEDTRAYSALLAQPADLQIAQRFCAGQVRSTFSFARRGEPLVIVTYRGVMMEGTVAICFERLDTSPQIEAWVRAFLLATTFEGFVSFDFIEAEDGSVHGIECNPRATSGLHFVEPLDLAGAILDPESSTALRYRPERLMQQFYPCLTETQKAMFGPRFREYLRLLRAARDVTWSAKDPWPMLGMPLNSAQIILAALRQGATFGEVAMQDFEWSGEAAVIAATPTLGVKSPP